MRKAIVGAAFSVFVLIGSGVAAQQQQQEVEGSPAECWLPCAEKHPSDFGKRFQCVSACCGC